MPCATWIPLAVIGVLAMGLFACAPSKLTVKVTYDGPAPPADLALEAELHEMATRWIPFVVPFSYNIIAGATSLPQRKRTLPALRLQASTFQLNLDRKPVGLGGYRAELVTIRRVQPKVDPGRDARPFLRFLRGFADRPRVTFELARGALPAPVTSGRYDIPARGAIGQTQGQRRTMWLFEGLADMSLEIMSLARAITELELIVDTRGALVTKLFVSPEDSGWQWTGTTWRHPESEALCDNVTLSLPTGRPVPVPIRVAGIRLDPPCGDRARIERRIGFRRRAATLPLAMAAEVIAVPWKSSIVDEAAAKELWRDDVQPGVDHRLESPVERGMLLWLTAREPIEDLDLLVASRCPGDAFWGVTVLPLRAQSTSPEPGSH